MHCFHPIVCNSHPSRVDNATVLKLSSAKIAYGKDSFFCFFFFFFVSFVLFCWFFVCLFFFIYGKNYGVIWKIGKELLEFESHANHGSDNPPAFCVCKFLFLLLLLVC